MTISPDDDVIDQRRGHEIARLGEAQSELDVLLARRRIAARVVVNQHHCARPFTERDTQRIADMELQAMKAAARYTSLGAQATLTVDREHPQLLVIEVTKPRAPPRSDTLAVVDGWGAGELRRARAAAKLQRRSETRSLSRSEALEPPPTTSRQARDAATSQEHLSTLYEGARARLSQHESQELRVPKGIDPEVRRPL